MFTAAGEEATFEIYYLSFLFSDVPFLVEYLDPQK